jgi:hypothetical protein
MIKKSFTARTKFNRAQRKSQLAIQAITIGDLSARFQFHVAVVQWPVETPREIASRHIRSFSQSPTSNIARSVAALRDDFGAPLQIHRVTFATVGGKHATSSFLAAPVRFSPSPPCPDTTSVGQLGFGTTQIATLGANAKDKRQAHEALGRLEQLASMHSPAFPAREHTAKHDSANRNPPRFAMRYANPLHREATLIG